MHEELIAKINDLIQESRCNSKYYTASVLKEAADVIRELSQIAAHYEEESKGWWLAACDAKEKIEELQRLVEASKTSHWMPLPTPPDHIGDATEMVEPPKEET